MKLRTILLAGAVALVPLTAFAQDDPAHIAAQSQALANDPSHKALVQATEKNQAADHSNAQTKAQQIKQAIENDPAYPLCVKQAAIDKAQYQRFNSGVPFAANGEIIVCESDVHQAHREKQKEAKRADISRAAPAVLPPDDAAKSARYIQESCYDLVPIPVGKHMTLQLYLGADGIAYKAEVVTNQTTTDQDLARVAAEEIAKECGNDFPPAPDSLRYVADESDARYSGAYIVTLRFVHDPDSRPSQPGGVK